MKRELTIDPNAKVSVDVQGDFQFDSVAPPDQSDAGKKFGMRDRAGPKAAKKAAKEKKKLAAERAKQGLPPLEAETPKDPGVPFALREIDLQIPRGVYCIIICLPAH